MPAIADHCNTWRWLVVVSSAKQKQQQHHQQLTNGSTILKTFTFPENLDLFELIYSLFWINFSNNILATYILQGVNWEVVVTKKTHLLSRDQHGTLRCLSFYNPQHSTQHPKSPTMVRIFVSSAGTSNNQQLKRAGKDKDIAAGVGGRTE
jgi:hypothetical protein